MAGNLVSAENAVSVIRDGDTVCVSGFVGVGTPDELLIALEKRFLETGHPRDLTLVFAAAPGDGKDRGLNRLAHQGLVKRGVGGHWSLVPKLAAMAVAGKIEAYNLPLGCVSQLYREIAGGKPGMLSKVGLRTFVDPRLSGGKINDRTNEDLIELQVIGGEEWLFYKAFPIHVALLRATTADTIGNATMEREALKLDATAQAMATHNSDGVVIVQIERIAIHGSLIPKRVIIPGALVDCLVRSAPENHAQTYATPYNHAFSGELRQPLDQVAAFPLDERKVIARRAAFELPVGGVVNLGIGMPEGVAAVAAEESMLDCVTLTAEPGVIGGMPQGGLDFGAALNPDAIIAQSAQFDFYDGGGLDMACLGMAQTDRLGNVNVSKFGPRFAGAGGFINISQNASRLVLAGTMTAGGLKVVIEDGEIRIVQEGRVQKFVPEVEQVTFSGELAAETGQPVLYVTERCVFRGSPRGLELIEVAPGIDIERDILPQMGFAPVIDEVRPMDPRIFLPDPMGLRAEFLEAPLDARITFDAAANRLEVNLRGYSMSDPADLTLLQSVVSQYCDGREGQVNCIVWYDGFQLKDSLLSEYTDVIAHLEKRYYRSTVRYTRSPFQRLRFGAELAKRDLSARVGVASVVTGRE
ncbi:MAG: acyl CoA:acetate/3-ketoacid CoA transferase [Silicimonas sp.]|nr:acyl CoA:acetate/3-ketoacid CoA transferase [Silicimonas sp.]NND17680.1 acyl CoA:acetate/3-ketoacid CoA transferase [Silicimonas sp.]NND20656.1 acyl CoA:acetate/3-ketoacid CoA transferase [Silicimonas sp.]NND42947.1 acyl CoA:acetate/3-ketoacid CoA transferase [Silicimonas sp.]NNL71741.1 acyl CoA:acetate/3-ketoacid CoA transferase [Silicimonas sp.]